MSHFLLVGHPRTGNVLLTKILNQHPGLYCAGEIFNNNPEHEHVFHARSLLNRAAPLGVPDLKEFFDVCSRHEQRTYIGVTLFGRPTHALSIEEVVGLVGQYPTIFLHRHNLLKAFCSYKRAEVTNVWHRDQRGQPLPWRGVGPPQQLAATTQVVDVDEAEWWIGQTKQFLQAVQTALANRPDGGLTVRYEDLCSPDATRLKQEVDRVFDYLGVERAAFEIKTQSTGGDEFYQHIANRAGLEARLGYSLLPSA